MFEPIILPSGELVNRTTAERLVMSDGVDPFTRAPMGKIEDLKPNDELREKIHAWIRSKGLDPATCQT